MEEITEKLREVLGPRSDPDANAAESDEKDDTSSPGASSKEATLDAHNRKVSFLCHKQYATLLS